MYAIINPDAFDTIVLKDILASNPKIGALPYRTIDFDAFNKVIPGAEFTFYNNWHQLLDSFAANELALMICTESETSYTEIYFEKMHTATMVIDTASTMQFFINKKIADDYIPIFNIMADRITKREYDAIIEINANKGLPQIKGGLWETIKVNWYYFIISLFVIAVAFIALYYRQQISKQEALLKSYNTDPLTGLMTIQKFRETIDDTLEKAMPGEYEIISFDIDMFKTINTHFSTERGTTLITAIANSLKEAFNNTKAIISRRSADQFLIFRTLDDGGSIYQIYNSTILPAIENNIHQKYKVSLSFGNVIIDDIKAKGTSLIAQADNARVSGKSSHETTFISFDDKMRKQYENKINITFRMEQALKDHEFVVEFQPKIDFTTLRLSGAEALVRWHPNEGNKIFPDEFIPVFEENGFIPSLDLYVIDEVCRWIKKHNHEFDIPCISVNLSAHTVLADDIVERISETLARHGVDSNKIELELTESAVEANASAFFAAVTKFKNLRFVISIDDFGAGVSSLNRLSSVDADILKLDKTFLDLKDTNEKSPVIITDVINMAKHLNMKVVAEGVETATQAAWLREVGCDYAQGYYFARPMSSDNFRQILIEQKPYSIDL